MALSDVSGDNSPLKTLTKKMTLVEEQKQHAKDARASKQRLEDAAEEAREAVKVAKPLAYVALSYEQLTAFPEGNLKIRETPTYLALQRSVTTKTHIAEAFTQVGHVMNEIKRTIEADAAGQNKMISGDMTWSVSIGATADLRD